MTSPMPSGEPGSESGAHRGPFRRADRRPDLVTDDNGGTFLIVSAGGPFTAVLGRLQVELDEGRRVSVVATPTAAAWFDHYGAAQTVRAMTGWPLRHTMPVPTDTTFDPPGSRVVASPCTLNTLTKWADGHSDNLAVSLLCEAVGRGVPTVAEVSLSSAYLSHPAADAALHRLHAMGVELRRAHGGAEHPLLAPLPSAVAAVFSDQLDGGGAPPARPA